MSLLLLFAGAGVAVVTPPDNPPTPASVPGSGNRREDRVWLTSTSAGQPQFVSMARYTTVVPLTSTRRQVPVATPLPAPLASWNDEQDLRDILRLIGMT